MQKKKRKKIYSSTQETFYNFTLFQKQQKEEQNGRGVTVCYAEGLKLREKSNSVCGDVGGEV